MIIIYKHTPIYCPKCGCYVDDEENYTQLVLFSDVHCRQCGEIVIYNTQPIWM